MDGVLVRSEEVWFRVVEAAGVRFRNRAITREEFFPTFGQGTAADIPVFGLSCTPAELDAFYVSQFVKHLDAMWVNPEAAPVVEALRARGLQVALVTNTVAPLTKAILEHAKLAHLFEVRATADRVANAKPAPDLVQLALKELKVAQADAVMVGDSKYDRQSRARPACGSSVSSSMVTLASSDSVIFPRSSAGPRRGGCVRRRLTIAPASRHCSRRWPCRPMPRSFPVRTSSRFRARSCSVWQASNVTVTMACCARWRWTRRRHERESEPRSSKNGSPKRASLGSSRSRCSRPLRVTTS